MRSRLTKLSATVAALAALAVGGSALASAAHTTAPPATPSQQGNQAAPTIEPADATDNSAEAASGAVDTDNIQQGDQTSSDTAGAQSEQAASESGPSDGPGGYADTNANADTQQQGEH